MRDEQPKQRTDNVTERYDIVIVGAGLVGATLALAIANEPSCAALSIAVIEPAAAPKRFQGANFDPRVVALTRNSERLFTRLGVWRAILEQRACAYQHMFVWDGEGTGHIVFDCHDFHEPNLGHIVENSVILHAVLENLSDCANVSILRSHPITAIDLNNGAAPITDVILDNGMVLQTQLLLAADGANSKVRELLAMSTREWDYGHSAIVTTVRASYPHQFTAWQRFMTTGPLAFLPLRRSDGDDHYCSIVWSLANDRLAEMMALDDRVFAIRLATAFEQRLGAIESVAQRFSFPLRQRHAVRYTQPGVALVGDAAHTIHPLAGQGVNLGLLDVQALAAELGRACQRRVPLADGSILRRYQRARMGHNLTMMGVMESFKRLFGSVDPVLHVARNAGMTGLNRMSLLKNTVAKQAMGL